ncbi:MAG: hypothetical protein FJ271_03020 [Planctomycetes bacterium]|nr:hypothetical protein [Planctomycetota bacterium]
MAKEVTKSAAIREYLKGHRRAKAKTVVAALADEGIEVTEGLVYAAKRSIKGKRKRRLAAAAITKTNPNGAVDAITLVKKVRELAVQAGGIKKLKELLEMLS